MGDHKGGRGRLSPGALRPLKGAVRCHSCLHTLDQAQKPTRQPQSNHVLCPSCTITGANECQDLFCRDCWKHTDKAKPIPIAPQPLCLTPNSAPPSPLGPTLWSSVPTIFREEPLSHAYVTNLCGELNYFEYKQHNFLMRALETTTTFKTCLEAELLLPPPIWSFYSNDAFTNMEHLRLLHTSALVRYRLNELVASAGVLLDFEAMRRALLGLQRPDTFRGTLDPMLFMANYYAAQLYMRTCLQQPDEMAPGAPPLLRMPPSFPLFYFNLEVNGVAFGRLVIAVRSDVAPRMARNFSMLTTGERGFGYRGCTIFQCWENESVITGDFEHNNGSGGHSAFKEESFFVPDASPITPGRGAVGMCRSQKRRSHFGLVGSQFRIILRDLRGFSTMFGHLVEGVELVEQLSFTGNGAGEPHSTILISSCGKLN